MRDYFKYKFGYVNIDSEIIYFTSTGNWSEVTGMKEKGAQKQKVLKKTGIYIFLIISVVALLFLILNNIDSGKISLLLLIGFPIGLYLAYKYLSTELGSQFKLPISKITNIEIENNTIHLTFLNYNKETSTYQIEGTTAKGVNIMTKIKDLI
jgi:hypothetical protein